MSFSFTDVELFISTTLVGTCSLTTAGVFTVDDTSDNQLGSWTLGVNETSGAITSGDLSPVLTITIGSVSTSYDKISGTFKSLPEDHGGGTIHEVHQITGGQDPSWSAGGTEVGHPQSQKKAGQY